MFLILYHLLVTSDFETIEYWTCECVLYAFGGRESLCHLLIARDVFGAILQLRGTGCRLQICIQIQISGLPELEIRRR